MQEGSTVEKSIMGFAMFITEESEDRKAKLEPNWDDPPTRPAKFCISLVGFIKQR